MTHETIPSSRMPSTLLGWATSSEGWAASDWNGGRLEIGMGVRDALESASIALEPANQRHETRIFPVDRVKVQGRLVALLRRY